MDILNELKNFATSHGLDLSYQIDKQRADQNVLYTFHNPKTNKSWGICVSTFELGRLKSDLSVVATYIKKKVTENLLKEKEN